MTGRLASRRILVPESRELDLFARMLEAEGATALRCPLVTILDLDDPSPVEAWLAHLLASEFDDLILLTGEGLRRILAVAEHIGKKAEAVDLYKMALESCRSDICRESVNKEMKAVKSE